MESGAGSVLRIELQPRVPAAEAELSREEVLRWDTDRMMGRDEALAAAASLDPVTSDEQEERWG